MTSGLIKRRTNRNSNINRVIFLWIHFIWIRVLQWMLGAFDWWETPIKYWFCQLACIQSNGNCRHVWHFCLYPISITQPLLGVSTEKRCWYFIHAPMRWESWHLISEEMPIPLSTECNVWLFECPTYYYQYEMYMNENRLSLIATHV